MHDALNGTDADAELCRDLLDAFALEARGTDPFLDARWYAWLAQNLALRPNSPALRVELLPDGDPARQSSVLGGVCASGLGRLLPGGVVVDVPA